MSLTVEQIIMDAERLVNKLKRDECSAELLTSDAQAICTEIETMKQYAEHLRELNETAGQRPHSVSIAEMLEENKHLRELQLLNRDLRSALEKHRSALEIIMSKFRQQKSSLLDNSDNEVICRFYDQYYLDIVQHQTNKIEEMAGVISAASQVEDSSDIKSKEELIERLTSENKKLRQFLSDFI